MDQNTELRSMPCNIEAEQRIIGKILINNDVINNVTEFLRPEYFFEPIHQKIYSAIEKIIDKGFLATPTTLKSMLSTEEIFKTSEGTDYLAKLISLSMMVINIRDYAKIVYDLSVKRSLIAIGESIVNSAFDSSFEQSAEMQIEAAENQLYELAGVGINDKSFVSIKSPVEASVASIGRAMKNPKHVTGISTGFTALDQLLAGFHNSDLVILAGRPSMGKTALAINLAVNACYSLIEDNLTGEKKSVGFFSLEMSSEQLTTRILSMHTEINSAILKSGTLNEEEYNKVQREAIKLSDLSFFVDDTPSLTINAIRTRARKMKRKHNLAILFVDYLQLIRGSTKHENRVIEISTITQGLKAIAKELDIPVIALAQLSRAVETRDDKKPMLSDLRESGSIEQDSDIVMFIYREEYYLSRKEPSHDDPKYGEWAVKLQQSFDIAEVLVAKHRNGAVGNVRIKYDSKISKFGNLSPRT